MGLGFQMACPQACSIKSTMATDVKTQLAEHPLMSPRCLRGQWRTAQKTQGPGQRNPQRAPRPLLSISRAHLFSRGPPFSQGHREKGMQTASSPRAELKPEKKSGHRPRSHGDNGPQKELMIPGIVDFQLIQTALKTPKPQTPGAYRFGRLSHHSFFSRHHPHPQRVTHIQGPPSHSLSPFADLTGKPVCVVRDEFSVAPLPQATLLSRCLMGLPTISVPIGDPQSNREPRLSSGLSMPGTTGKAGGPRVSAGNVFPEAWKKELRDLASRVAVFTKENELKSKEKEEPQREQGAKYSAETGRLIPTSTRVIGRRHSRQGPRMYSSGKDEGVQTVFLKDHELLVLELLCQILQTDSLSAIQFWLLYAPPKEKDLALGLLQTAVAQQFPQPLASIPLEKLLHQLQEFQEPSQEKKQPPYSQSPKKTKTPPLPKGDQPGQGQRRGQLPTTYRILCH
ncbi:protein TBATA isoform X12 [Canis lupus baileyi]|uniref:protein TBATA isoform X70 n=1 Tax=Canis lupus familiaris TaxID=9615 RepID=UPI000BA9FE86|nr:protein TBATA isoform X70 [Canis lupus familiaris]XP_025290717.3 protein TBATA isoform X12 [Canis lupus dingo]XP_038390165.1 protein TBATA isoform X51 [Canis lupus familiaris]|eukprot:XP_022273241.1 protein TBATA isoform X2 [Canis lupus familiaris]